MDLKSAVLKMKFTETPLPGAYLVELEPHTDERGFFARSYSPSEFREQGLRDDLTEVSLSRNLKAGTLRGMHFQKSPHAETKLVRVVHGRAFDVIVDIRHDSPTFGQWHGQELSAEGGQALYVPAGFAHGFLTRDDHTDVLYQITDTFEPGSIDGFAWYDPNVGIAWPGDVIIASQSDHDQISFIKRTGLAAKSD